MRGAIIGDIIGSAFINSPQPPSDFQLLKPVSAYTDDTILTIATADAIVNNRSYAEAIQYWTMKFPRAGYRSAFLEWALAGNPELGYVSEGDGAARRVSPIGFAANTIDEALEETRKATIITHPSEDKVKAAQALTGSIFLARTGRNKVAIKDFVCNELGYELPIGLSKDCVSKLKGRYNSPVPCSIMAFLESQSFEEAIRLSIGLDGPSNTLGSITGAIAQAYYKHIPRSIHRKALSRLAPELEEVLLKFEEVYCQSVLSVKNEIQFNFH